MKKDFYKVEDGHRGLLQRPIKVINWWGKKYSLYKYIYIYNVFTLILFFFLLF